MKEKRTVRLWLLELAADFFAVVTAYYTTMLIRFHSDWGASLFNLLRQSIDAQTLGKFPPMYEDFYIGSALRITLLMTTIICILYALHDLYPGRRFIRARATAGNILVANGIALGIFYAYFYLSRNEFHPRSFFATTLFFNAIYTIAFRSAGYALLRYLRTHHRLDPCPALLIGSRHEADLVHDLIQTVRPHGIYVAAHIGFDPKTPFLERLGKIEGLAREKSIGMIISADKRMPLSQIMEFLDLADRLDIPAKVLSDRMEVLLTRARIPMDLIHGVPLAHFEAPSAIRRYRVSRQLVSWIVAAVGLLVLSPLFGIIALLVRLTSPGPVFFVQERIGVDRRPFRMFKFRTMRDRAHELQAQVEEFNESGQALFKIKNDPRVTPVGRFLRRFSLDELPQLINVLKGEMVLVGPRPLPRRDFENYYEDWHYGRHGGMPGLTCLWQVSGRSDLDFHSMCILDIYYLRNKGWVLDLKIILRTFWAILFAKGAY